MRKERGKKSIRTIGALIFLFSVSSSQALEMAVMPNPPMDSEQPVATQKTVTLVPEKGVRQSPTIEMQIRSLTELCKTNGLDFAKRVAALKILKPTQVITFKNDNANALDEESTMKDYRLALQHVSQGETKEAEKLLLTVLERAPTHQAARSELATLYLKTGELKNCEKIVKAGLQLENNNRDFLKLLAMVYDKQGETNEALVIAEKLKGERIPLKTFDSTFSNATVSTVSLNKTGAFSKKMNDPNDVYDDTDKGIERKVIRANTHAERDSEGPLFIKTKPSLSLEEEAMFNYRQAEEHINRGQTVDAERLLVSILQKLPAHHAARVMLATLYINRGETDRTEELILDGLKMDDSYPDFLKLMAMVHDNKGEPDKALSLLVRVKDSGRENTNYIAFLGYLYQETGRYALARQQYFRLLQIEPKNAHWLLGMSVALDSEGQRAAALEGYHKLVNEGSIDPKVLEFIQNRIKELKG